MEKVLRERVIDAKKCVEEAIYMLFRVVNDLSSPTYTSTSISKEQLLKDLQLRLSAAITKLRDCHRILKEVVYAK